MPWTEDQSFRFQACHGKKKKGTDMSDYKLFLEMRGMGV
jgi:hypothetical protein